MTEYDSTSVSNNSRNRGVYFGWYVVAATTFVVFVTAGARSVFGVFVVPMSDEFEWSRFTISIAAALGVLVNGLVQPFAGQVFDRTGGRRLILFGLIFVGLSTILLSLTFHIIFLILVFGIVAAVASSGASVTNTGALMARWFRRKRATAMGINATGLSMGGLIMVPLAWYLMDATSWRVAWAAMGIIVLVAVPLAIIFVHQSPAVRGLLPDGDPEPPDDANGEEAEQKKGPLEVDRWAREKAESICC